MTIPGGGERFRRADRLRSSKDFRRVSREGTRMASRSFVLLVADQRDGDPEAPARLGITVSRRVGGAVVRARVKRRLREWFRRHRAGFPKGKDVIVVARPSAAALASADVGRELEAVLARLGRAAR